MTGLRRPAAGILLCALGAAACRSSLPEERRAPPPEDEQLARPPAATADVAAPSARGSRPQAPTDAEILAIVKKQIGDAGAACVEVRWDTSMRSAGDSVPAGPAVEKVPFDGYFVFVDLLPEANWGHPALYLFVAPGGQRVEAARGQFPPYADDYPPSFHKLTLGTCRRR